MPAANRRQRNVLGAAFILAVLCASVYAVKDDAVDAGTVRRGPTDARSNEQHPLQNEASQQQQQLHTCPVLYRLDDVTEMSDEIRRCLIS